VNIRSAFSESSFGTFLLTASLIFTQSEEDNMRKAPAPNIASIATMAGIAAGIMITTAS
jgi:hypothetical protein